MKYQITVEYTGHKTFIVDLSQFTQQQIGAFFNAPDMLENHSNAVTDRLNTFITAVELIDTQSGE